MATPSFKEGLYHALAFMGGTLFIAIFGTLLHCRRQGCEVFYVLLLTQTVSVMPDVQYWHRNDQDGPGARTWVLGLRTEFEF